ncbi:hypothetical protein [Gimesia fumaroli]|jgi:fatty acid desaturase|uniref:Uncharacterized protein n=1 Tax=Gimesia fumaroli TaxID=2527976 RepID=A0A518IIX7_9PLAN|nr:hypothetical protein [Gimesia fumaroli]QDV53049.1 hypothetical protein Enr17x_51190 [Gimesia fumaroli]
MTAGRSPHGSGDQAAAWLATVFTLVGGLFACVFVVVSSGEPPGRPMIIAIGVITVLLLVLWLLRDKPPEAHQDSLRLWHWWKKKDAETCEYKPRPRKRSSHVNYGNNQPPTLESIRETVDDQRTWVPSIRNIQETNGDSTDSQGE